MSLAVPPPEIIRLTVENPLRARLADPMGTAEARSPLCGSRVVVDVDLDREGRVIAAGMQVNACAFGQAAATLLARNLVGRSVDELAATRDALADWLGGIERAPDWPEIEHLRPDRLNTVRKGSVQLAFRAAAEAAAAAACRSDRQMSDGA